MTRRLPRVPFTAALFVLACVLQLVRQPGKPATATIWAEDGPVFLTHAWSDAFGSTVVDVYNGYLHVVPRLIAGVVALLPLRDAAFGLAVGAAVVVSALAVYVFHASRSVLESPWPRLLLAATMVLLPQAAYETNANLANLHWYLIYAAFWALLANPRSRSGVAVGALIVVGAALSDPLAGLLLPLAAARAWQGRAERARLVIPALLCVAMAVQLAFAVSANVPARNSASHAGELVGIYAVRVSGSALVGDRWLGGLWRPLGAVFAVAAVALVAALLVYGYRKADRPRRELIAWSAALSILTLAVPLAVRGTAFLLDRPAFTLSGSRYTVLPVLFLYGALVVTFSAWRGVRVVAAAALVAVLVTSYRVEPLRSSGPDWKNSLAAARAECAQASGSATVRVPVAPIYAHGPQLFAVALRCGDVR
jgi:hypothetical protein